MRRRIVDGLNVGIGGEPRGRARVVFVHGAMDRGAAFLRVARRLDGVQWVVTDRRGYGRSRLDDAAPPRFDEHVDDLITVVDSSPFDGPTVLVGHSIGGTVVLAAMDRRPDLASSAMVFEPPLSWLDWWPNADQSGRRIEDDDPVTAVDRFMERVVGSDEWRATPVGIREQRHREGRTLVAELVSLRSRPAFDPERIEQAVLVARGSDCDDIRRRAAAWLVESLPRGELRVLERAPHLAHTTHPETFAACVTEAVEIAVRSAAA